MAACDFFYALNLWLFIDTDFTDANCDNGCLTGHGFRKQTVEINYRALFVKILKHFSFLYATHVIIILSV